MVSVGLRHSQVGKAHKVFHGKAFLALAFQKELLWIFSSSLYVKARRIVRDFDKKWLQSMEAFWKGISLSYFFFP